MRKIRIKGLPQANKGGSTGAPTQGLDRFIQGENRNGSKTNPFSDSSLQVNKTIKGVDPSEANVEAEGKEQVVVPGQGGIPESYKVSGPRHNGGGVPLNLAPDSFIFSDHKKGMKIKDKEILKEFGMSVPSKGKSKGYTPAEIAKKYDINEYKKILLDPNADKMQKETAEQMIENYNMKLGKLALVQESMKGFPQDIPAIAMPYLQTIQADPSQFLPKEQQSNGPLQQAMHGGQNNHMAQRFSGLEIAKLGKFIPEYQQGGGMSETPTQDEYYAEMFKNIETPEQALSLLKGQMLATGQETSDDQVLKTVGNIPVDQAYFDALKQYTGMEFENTTSDTNSTWAYKGNVNEQAKPKVSNKPFVPGFKYEDDKLYQKKQGRLTGEEHWEASNPNMARIYAGKYGADKTDPKELMKFIGENPEEFANTWGQGNLQASNSQTPYIQAYGGDIKPVRKMQQGGFTEDDYTTEKDSFKINPDVNTYQNNPPAKELTPDQVTLIYGTKEEKEAVLSKLKYDAEAAGLDENAYVNEAIRDMTWEEIEHAEKNMKGFPIKSLKKELEWEAKQLKKATGIDSNPEQTVGNTVKTQEKPTYNVPKDAIIHEEDDEYDESKVKKGEYVRKKDGKLYQATGKTFSDIKYDQLENIPEKHRDAYSRSYALLKKTLTDPDNKELTDQLYENYKDRISKGKIDDLRKEKLMNLPKEKVIENLLKAQKQIYAINTHAAEDPELLKRIESGAMDSSMKKDPVTGRRYAKNEAYKDIAKSLGYEDDELLSDDDIAVFQGAYQGLSDLSRNSKYKDKLENFNLKPVGVDDQDWEGGKSISPVDDWFGNTTIGQAATAKEDKMAFKEAEVQAKKEAIRQGKSPEYVEESMQAPWWAQDVGNMALTVAERAQLKKYLPHSQPIDLAKPDVLYYDPSRALAANAEQANIAAQTIGSFAGPQGTARLTGVQGQAFANAANTLADYENKNVGVGNQYLNRVQQTLNQESLANNERMQRLYDQTTVANQQFDNAKTASNRNIFEAWRQGLTNATETQSLNTLYPQFNVDPSRGGPTGFSNGRPLTGQGSGAGNDENYFAEIAAYKQKYPDLDESTITAKLGPKYGKGKEPFGKDYREDLRRFVEDQGRFRRR